MIVLRIVGNDGAMGIRVLDASDVAIVARKFMGDSKFDEMVKVSGVSDDPSRLIAYIELDEGHRLGIPSTVTDFKLYADGVLMLDSESL